MPQTASARRTLRRRVLAVAATAALLGGTVFAGTAGAAPGRGPKVPQPPARMSTVGGDRLGVPGTQVDLSGGAPPLPAKVTARSWVVADAETGDILAAHNAHWQLAPASTLKMLFADAVLPKFPKTEQHVVAATDLKGMGEGSSLVGIQENQGYSVKDLWLGVFLRSGNDAVHVLAAMNGGVPKTVADMNAMAKELQAGDTNVVTPDGYDEPNQHSSAYDLTLFARQGLQNPDFRAYCSTVVAQFPGDYKKDKNGKPTKVRGSFQIQNTDRLLSGDYDLARYPGIAGVKNGNTTNAGATYTGVAQRDGRTLLVTVMNPEPKHNQVYREAGALLDWGFKAAATAKPVGTLVPPLSQVKASASAAPQPSGTGGKRIDASASASASSSHGLWTAAGVTLGTALVLAVVVTVIRRRRPLPAGGADGEASERAPAEPGEASEETPAEPGGHRRRKRRR
ncbi:D-alanyl-D-alanine carboxypeptidase family protein [Streptomyces sp. NBC_01477]|uniref:D-alanyl-D-alanine carboxypeptidase family protein n=1 Tax=Streptomyces sp. NBC_01477 TaxID=2976015 RepID=UPI002E376683|nr:D-alanyl-D-alanine carboxypeptidase [Streptomyces sp. NBC_01477]